MCESAVFTTAMSSISIAVARQTTASVPRLLKLVLEVDRLMSRSPFGRRPRVEGRAALGQVVEGGRRSEDLGAVAGEQACHLGHRRHDSVAGRLGGHDGNTE